MMMWMTIETAPFDRDLELAVIEADGIAHSLAFPAVAPSKAGSRLRLAAPLRFIRPTGAIGTTKPRLLLPNSDPLGEVRFCAANRGTADPMSAVWR